MSRDTGNDLKPLGGSGSCGFAVGTRGSAGAVVRWPPSTAASTSWPFARCDHPRSPTCWLSLQLRGPRNRADLSLACVARTETADVQILPGAAPRGAYSGGDE